MENKNTGSSYQHRTHRERGIDRESEGERQRERDKGIKGERDVAREREKERDRKSEGERQWDSRLTVTQHEEGSVSGATPRFTAPRSDWAQQRPSHRQARSEAYQKKNTTVKSRATKA